MLARHFGAKKILLLGFDLEHPHEQAGKSGYTKSKKLAWAKRLIFDMNPKDVELIMPSK